MCFTKLAMFKEAILKPLSLDIPKSYCITLLGMVLVWSVEFGGVIELPVSANQLLI